MSGLIILPILIVYILFAMLMYKLTASKIVLIVILVFPVWDLIVLKGIQTYYQVFESEPKIYSMPELDEDGKIESLGVVDIIYTTIDYFKTQKDFEDFKISNKEIYSRIKEFVELTTRNYKAKNKLRSTRVYLSDKVHKRYKFIDKQKARYQIIASKPEIHFFGFYQKRTYKFIDTKQNNKVLAEAYAINPIEKMRFFRRNILGWQTGNGMDMVNAGGAETVKEMYEKVLNINTPTYGFSIYSKGWKDE